MNMSMSMNEKPKGTHCPQCHGVRLFVVVVRRSDDGRRLRCRECSSCGHQIDFEAGECPGLCCPKCCNIRLRVIYTRHRKRATVRVRKCAHCNRRIRTAEKVESNAA